MTSRRQNLFCWLSCKVTRRSFDLIYYFVGVKSISSRINVKYLCLYIYIFRSSFLYIYVNCMYSILWMNEWMKSAKMSFSVGGLIVVQWSNKTSVFNLVFNEFLRKLFTKSKESTLPKTDTVHAHCFIAIYVCCTSSLYNKMREFKWLCLPL